VNHDGEGEVVSFDDVQEARFLAAAARDRWAPYWFLMRDTGMRPGEVNALKWEDVDVVGTIDADGDRVYLVKVRHTVRRVGVKKQSGGAQSWELVVPKTKTSERDIPISENTVAALEEWRERQRQEKKQAGDLWQDHGFVFTTERGTPLGENVGRMWDRVLKEADQGEGIFGTWGPEPAKPKSGPAPEREFKRRFSPYVLRHTMATQNYLDGMPLELLSRRLGHTDAMFTFKR